MPKFRQSQGEVINQTNDPAKFVIISSEKSNGCVSLPAIGAFCGGVYASNTDIIVKGQGVKIIGALVGNSIKVSGSVTINYAPEVLSVVLCIPRQIVCGKKWWGPPPPYEPGKYPIITDFKVVPDPEEPLFIGEERTYQIILLSTESPTVEVPLDVFPPHLAPRLWNVIPTDSALVEVVGMHPIPLMYRLHCLGPGVTEIYLELYIPTNPHGEQQWLEKTVSNNQTDSFVVKIQKCPSDFEPKGGVKDDNTVRIRAFVTPTTINGESIEGKFIFYLFAVSNEPGYCMNAPQNVPILLWYEEDSTAWKDLQFPEQSGFIISGEVNNKNVAETDKSNLTEAKVTVKCYDYGAYGKIKAVFIYKNEQFTAIEEGGKKIIYQYSA